MQPLFGRFSKAFCRSRAPWKSRQLSSSQRPSPLNYQSLLDNNKIWAAKKIAEDPDYFKRLADIQKPTILWIGCSDSRVPPNETTGTRPGDIFVHRNVANQVIHADFNMLSVLQYAVEVLQVPDIIVCGHYGCGGVRSATTRTYSGLISKWLRHIKDTYTSHQDELSRIHDPRDRENRLVELNVEEQVLNLAQMGIVQRAWRRNGFHDWNHIQDAVPRLHGWVYDINTGLMKEVPIDLTKVAEIYRLKFDDPLHPLPPGLHSYDLD